MLFGLYNRFIVDIGEERGSQDSLCRVVTGP